MDHTGWFDPGVIHRQDGRFARADFLDGAIGAGDRDAAVVDDMVGQGAGFHDRHLHARVRMDWQHEPGRDRIAGEGEHLAWGGLGLRFGQDIPLHLRRGGRGRSSGPVLPGNGDQASAPEGDSDDEQGRNRDESGSAGHRGCSSAERMVG